jgi:N-methylhydantoinase B
MSTTADTRTDYDVIDVEVHHKSLYNITKEMAITLLRTSGSPVVTEAKDFCTCLLDEDNEQLAFSGFVTFHISTAVLGVEAVLARTPKDQLRPGDAFMCNDPHTSGAIHQGDVGIVMPYFHEDELVGWGFANEHVLDIGGGAISGFAPEARDCFSETLRFSGIRVASGGVFDPQWEEFIATNVRVPGPVLNDIRSMLAGNAAGQRRITAVLEQIGVERFREYNRINKQLSEDAVRARIAALPDGTYDSEDWVEYDARGHEDLYNIRCRVTVEGDEMTIQFRGDPQVDAFVNGATPSMLGQSWSTLLCLLTWDIPVNAGLWRPVHFDLGPKGTIVNSVEPAPVTQSHMETGMRVNKVLIDALGQACSLSADPVLASRVTGQPVQGLPNMAVYGVDRRSGTPAVVFSASPASMSGGGAQTVIDGLDTYAAQCMTGCGIPDVEIDESSTPCMVLWRRIIPDTGGPGANRGGQGVESPFAVVNSELMAGAAFTSCAQLPPRGASGGFPGAAGSWHLLEDTNLLELLDTGVAPTPDTLKGTLRKGAQKTASLAVRRGDVFFALNGGGGGVGDPLFRDPSAVAHDVADGYTTVEHAAHLYGVVLAQDGSPDLDATTQRRTELRAARIGAAPTRPATPAASLAAITVAGAEWACASCGQVLGGASGNWRDAAITRQSPLKARFEEFGMNVEGRKHDPIAVLREHSCPSCASSLAVDVTLDGRGPVVAPGIGNIDRWEAGND